MYFNLLRLCLIIGASQFIFRKVFAFDSRVDPFIKSLKISAKTSVHISEFDHVEANKDLVLELDEYKITFTLEIQKGFVGDFKCTILGGLVLDPESYELDPEEFQRLLKKNFVLAYCEKERCLGFMQSYFSSDYIHDLDDLIRLHNYKMLIDITCEHLDTNNPAPFVFISEVIYLKVEKSVPLMPKGEFANILEEIENKKKLKLDVSKFAAYEVGPNGVTEETYFGYSLIPKVGSNRLKSIVKYFLTAGEFPVYTEDKEKDTFQMPEKHVKLSPYLADVFINFESLQRFAFEEKVNKKYSILSLTSNGISFQLETPDRWFQNFECTFKATTFIKKYGVFPGEYKAVRKQLIFGKCEGKRCAGGFKSTFFEGNVKELDDVKMLNNKLLILKFRCKDLQSIKPITKANARVTVALRVPKSIKPNNETHSPVLNKPFDRETLAFSSDSLSLFEIVELPKLNEPVPERFGIRTGYCREKRGGLISCYSDRIPFNRADFSTITDVLDKGENDLIIASETTNDANTEN